MSNPTARARAVVGVDCLVSIGVSKSSKLDSITEEGPLSEFAVPMKGSLLSHMTLA